MIPIIMIIICILVIIGLELCISFAARNPRLILDNPEKYKFIMKSNLQFKKKIEIILFYFFTPFIEFYKASK